MKRLQILNFPFYLLIVLCFLLPSVVFADSSTENPARETVILLHGLGRTHLSMATFEETLAGKGYRVINVNYPSTSEPIEIHAKNLGDVLKHCCMDESETIHFVTHSMGGIIVRYYLANNELKNLGRVVMLSPPNQGSEIVDTLKGNKIFQENMGPAAMQLGTDDDSLPNTLGPVSFELGIITGDQSLNPLYSAMIPGSDDGKVSVDNAQVKGMADFIVVPHSHSFIMNSETVIEQTDYFLKHGKFDHNINSTPAGGH